MRNPADLVLRQSADGKQRAPARLRHGVQEKYVWSLPGCSTSCSNRPSCIRGVAGGEPVGAEAQRVLGSIMPYLIPAIARDVGIRGAPCCSSSNRSKTMFGVAANVTACSGMPRPVADAARVLQIGRSRAVAILVFVRVARCRRVDVELGAPHRSAGDGRVDAALDLGEHDGAPGRNDVRDFRGLVRTFWTIASGPSDVFPSLNMRRGKMPRGHPRSASPLAAAGGCAPRKRWRLLAELPPSLLLGGGGCGRARR